MTEELPSSLFSLLEELDREGIIGYEKYIKVKRYIQFKAREKRVPVCGVFELTPLCNLSCKMCYVRLDREQMGGQELLPVETWISIIDQAVDAGMLYASVTGGECLTYDGFKDVYLHLQSKGIEIELLTNGILLTEDMVCFLDEHPPANIQITLYGPDDEEYERVTGYREFQKVMDNLARLKTHNLPFSVSITPNRYMTKGKELIRLLHDMGYPYKISTMLITPREETGRQLCDVSVDTYMDLFKEYCRLNGEEALTAIPDEDLPDPGTRESEIVEEKKGVRCSAGRSSFCVNWNGILRPCNSFPGIGVDMLETGFQAAWEQISHQVMEIPRPIECPGCPYENVCSYCILGHLGYGNPGHVNPDACERVKYLVKEGFIHL